MESMTLSKDYNNDKSLEILALPNDYNQWWATGNSSIIKGL